MGLLPLNILKNTVSNVLGIVIKDPIRKMDDPLLGTAKSIQSSNTTGTDTTPLVECLMHTGIGLAQEGKYDAAAIKFDEVVKIAPAYMPARLRLLQAYVVLDRHLDAAALAGHALALSTGSLDRSRVLLLMGENAKKLFQKTRSLDLLRDAIEYATRAHSDDKDDILSIWAMVETHLLGYAHFTDTAAKNESYEIAKTQFRNLLEMASTGRGNAREYLSRVVGEGRTALALVLNSQDTWWGFQFSELKAILAWGEFASEDRPRAAVSPVISIRVPLQKNTEFSLHA